MEGKIKSYQKKEFQMRKLAFDENMSFSEAQDAINKILRQELADKKGKGTKTTEPTKWTETVGTIVEVEHYRNRCVETEMGTYYISMQEPHLERFQTGMKVKCLVGHPGQHRGVAKELEIV